MDEKPNKDKYCSVTWKNLAIFFILLSLALTIGVIVLAVLLEREQTRAVPVKEPSPTVKVTTDKMTSDGCPDFTDQIDTTESDYPGVFHDLTHKEMLAVKKFLYSKNDLNLVLPSNATIADNYIFLVDLHLPPKDKVLDYLDKTGAQPNREALVVIFRGDISVVQEYLVGPLPNPTYLRISKTIPFYTRPTGGIEYQSIDGYLDEFMPKLANVFEESFKAEYCLDINKCLNYYNTYVNSGLIGKESRKMWLELAYELPFHAVHPIGMSLLLNIGTTSNATFSIERVEYDGRMFNSVDDFLNKFETGNITKIKSEPPLLSSNMFSTMYRRGKPVPEEPKRPPMFFEPDGKRYSIKNRHVKYMNWDFDVRMRTVSGLAVYDVRFRDERIAYEISLQELSVLYSGGKSAHKTTDFVDSAEIMIHAGHSLIPGSDCPETSSYIDSVSLGEGDDNPKKMNRVICIFEKTSGFPLHRHFSYGDSSRAFYAGMQDTALVVRSVLAVGNYDYIIDIVFHQTGVVHIQAAATGYIFASYYTKEEKDFGFRLHERITGNLHQHLIHFKIDLDIHGTKNRYETLNLGIQESPLDYSEGGNPNWRLKFSQHLKASESESAYKYVFQEPMYHVVHNKDEPTRFGDISGYRVHVSSMTHRFLPDDTGNEKAVSWSRYQMAITKYKETERSSSSPYAMYDSLDPLVKFSSFVADNETILDEDLVVWATVGVHHIPHMEDLPVTPTPGGALGVYLLPYNYFTECPSMSSRDRIYLEPNDVYDNTKGIKVEMYDNSDIKCVPKPLDLKKYLNSEMFDEF